MNVDEAQKESEQRQMAELRRSMPGSDLPQQLSELRAKLESAQKAFEQLEASVRR
ncbi:MAG: hypothetical protein ACPGUV_09990 [Polyangiales bacterium]